MTIETIKNPSLEQVQNLLAQLVDLSQLQTWKSLVDTLFAPGNEVLRPPSVTSLMIDTFQGFTLDYTFPSGLIYFRIVFTRSNASFVWKTAVEYPEFRSLYLLDMPFSYQIDLLLYHLTNPDLTQCT